MTRSTILRCTTCCRKNDPSQKLNLVKEYRNDIFEVASDHVAIFVLFSGHIIWRPTVAGERIQLRAVESVSQEGIDAGLEVPMSIELPIGAECVGFRITQQWFANARTCKGGRNNAQ